MNTQLDVSSEPADAVGVHLAHCCKVCGCRYRDPLCPVETGKMEPLFDCDECRDSYNQAIERIQEIPPRENFTINISDCSRCGKEHFVRFVKFNGNPVDKTYAYWGFCPTTRDPILLMAKIADVETQPTDENPQ